MEGARSGCGTDCSAVEGVESAEDGDLGIVGGSGNICSGEDEGSGVGDGRVCVEMVEDELLDEFGHGGCRKIKRRGGIEKGLECAGDVSSIW
jgi:hypothetical protein